MNNNKKMPERACFVIDGRKYFAAGALVVCGSKCMVLHGRRGYEMPGGKVEKSDASVYDTAQREVNEETNGLCDLQQGKVIQTVMDYRWKYSLFIVSVKKDQVKDDLEYGSFEVGNLCPRVVNWIEQAELLSILEDDKIKKLRIFNRQVYLSKAICRFLRSNLGK